MLALSQEGLEILLESISLALGLYQVFVLLAEDALKLLAERSLCLLPLGFSLLAHRVVSGKGLIDAGLRASLINSPEHLLFRLLGPE